MRKRILLMLLILAASIILSIVLVSCFDDGGGDETPEPSVHTHSGGTATCVSPAVCASCGEAYGEKDAAKHTATAEWVKDAATHKKVFTCCGAAEGDSAAHSFDGDACSVCGHVCTHSGGTASCIAKARCQHCGAEYGELGDHTAETLYVKDETHHWHNASCTHTSERLGYELHSYTAVVTAPTCLSQGYTTYTCVCGDSYQFDYVPASEHAHQQEFAYSDSRHWYVATCGHTTEKLEIADHSFTEAVTEPTCTQQGYTTYTCACGYSCKGNYVDPTGHSVETWARTGSALSDAASCLYEISYAGSCDTCHTEQTKKEYVENHSFYWHALTPATCSAAGARVKLCTAEACRYHSELSPKETAHYTDVAAHTWTVTSTVGATCVHTCSLCSETKTVVSSDTGSASLNGNDFSNADEIQFSDITIGFDDAAKNNLSSANSLTVGVAVLEGDQKSETIQNAALTSEQIALLGNKPIYDFTLSNGTNVSSLGGTATVRIPYELSDGENPNEIIIWYISNGALTPVKAAYSDGYVSFTTTHFSYYIPSGLTAEQYCAIYGHPADSCKTFDAGCMTEGYTICLHCGQIIARSTPTGHMWSSEVIVAPTCDLSGILKFTCVACANAYETTVMALGHSYLLTDYVAPTCTESGSLTHTCSRCNDSYTLIYAQLNHKYNRLVKDATCTEPGYTEHTCIACGDTIITELVAAPGHLFDSVWHKAEEGHYHVCTRCSAVGEIQKHLPGAPATEVSAEICTQCEYVLTPPIAHKHQLTKVEATAPTCTEIGNVEYYVCDCGKWFLDAGGTALIVDHLSVYLLATGHTVVSIPAVEPTCTESGYTAGLRCSVCEQYLRGHVTLEPTGHSYELTLTPATCMAPAVTVYTCHCGHSYTETGNAPLGHSYVTEVVYPGCTAGGYTKHTCTLCQHTYEDDRKEALGHDYPDEWTVTADEHYLSCRRCGSVKDQGAHQPDFAEATEEHGISCTLCGYMLQKKLEHTHQQSTHVAYTAATCTQSGNIAYYVCACGARFEDEACSKRLYSLSETVIPALGHDYTHTTVEADCTNEGYSTHTCAVCGDSYRDNAVDALGHQYESTVKEPTCTEGGYTTHTCERCGDTYEDSEQDPLGHQYKSTVKEPTCTEGGYTTHTCEKCGDTYEDSATQPLGHSHPDKWSYNEQEHFKLCLRCEEGRIAAAHVWDHEEATEEHGVSCTECGFVRESALGHVHSAAEVQPGSDATCTESGLLASYLCRCGKKFFDQACTNPVKDDAELIIPAAGHQPVVVEGVAPTCTSVGYSDSSACATCGAVLTERTELPMLEHSFKDGICEHCGAADGNAPETGDNRITVVCTQNEDGTLTVTVMAEEINMAGVMFTLSTNAAIVEGSLNAPEWATYHVDGADVNYILASGNNFEEEAVTFLTLALIPADDELGIALSVSEIYVFSESGELLTPAYTVTVVTP